MIVLLGMKRQLIRRNAIALSRYKNISEKEYAYTFKYKELFIRLEIESHFIIKYLAFSQSKNYFIKSKSNAFSNPDRFNHLFPSKYTDKNGYFSSYSKYHQYHCT